MLLGGLGATLGRPAFARARAGTHGNRVVLVWELRREDAEFRSRWVAWLGEQGFELPRKLRSAINRKTAAALGIAIPGDVLLRVDEVFG